MRAHLPCLLIVLAAVAATWTVWSGPQEAACDLAIELAPERLVATQDPGAALCSAPPHDSWTVPRLQPAREVRRGYRRAHSSLADIQFPLTAEALLALIEAKVMPRAWTPEGGARIYLTDEGALVVRAPQHIADAVGRFLEDLRAQRDRNLALARAAGEREDLTLR